MADSMLDKMSEKHQITDETKISELTVGEFKSLVMQLLDHAILEIEHLLPDPDQGKNLKPEIIEQLRQERVNPSPKRQLSDVLLELGIAEDE
jgi:hypothetical protein